MQIVNTYMFMRFAKVFYKLFVAIVLVFSFVSCHNDPVVLNTLATLNIELQKKSLVEGVARKVSVAEFDALVSLSYGDDTVRYNCKFVASDSVSEFYIYDYLNSDIVYAVLGRPFRLLVDASIEGIVFHGESDIYVLDGDPITVRVEFDSDEPVPQEPSPYVDLGLPSGLLWASCNLGANSPESYGFYFAWGETSAKQTYNWDSYSYYSNSSVTKYTDSDGLVVLEPTDDAATVLLGSGWRIPTGDDFDELYRNCTKTWTIYNGVNGCLFVGHNGNSIFMPASGGRSDESIQNDGSCGFYWLNSVDSSEPEYAWGFLVDSTSAYVTSYYRMYGQTIRPVCEGSF